MSHLAAPPIAIIHHMRNNGSCVLETGPEPRYLPPRIGVTSQAAVLMVLVFVSISTHATQVAPGWIHEHWTTAHGLPVNVINDIAQDHDGYLWLATFDGLVRFDGVRFTVFNSTTNPELPSNRFITITADNAGRLWLITEQHHLVRFAGGRFTRLDSGAGLPHDDVLSIKRMASDEFLVGTQAGLARYRNGRIEHLAAGELVDPVLEILPGNNTVWLGTDNGLMRLTDDRIDKHLTTEDGLPSGTVYGLAELDDSLWIGTSAGVSILENGTLQHLQLIEVISPFEVHGIARAAGIVWLATWRGVYGYRNGEVVHTPEPNQRYWVKSPPAWTDAEDVLWLTTGRTLLRDGQPVFHSDGDITLVKEDHEGNLWLATSQGLHRLRGTPFTAFRDAQGLASENIYPIIQAEDDAIWMGSLEGHLTHLQDGNVVNDFAIERGLPGTIWTLAENIDGTFWVGGTGLCRFNGETCSDENIPGTLAAATVRAVHRDRDNTFWFGSSAGLFRLSDEGWRRYTTADNVPRQEIRVFAEAPDGTLWMGTNGGGIVRFSRNQFTTMDTSDGLCSDLVRAIHVADDALWVGTEDRGLCHVELPLGDVPVTSRIDQAQGLYDYTVHRILDDGVGHLWMSGNRGIWKMDKVRLQALVAGEAKSARSIAFTERDGLPTREANGGVHPAGIRDRSGRLWFPTQAGAVNIDPRELPRNPPPPRALVEQISAGTGDHRKLFDPTDVPAILALTPYQRQVEIEYTAPSFVDPTGVQFRYRLEGVDDHWIEAGSRRQTTYANLRPGDYRFHVIAGNNDGTWNETGDHFSLTVPPRWFETRMFYLACALLLVTTGLISGQWRRRELERRRRALEIQVDQRTGELQQALAKVAEQAEALQHLDRAKSRFFANISHEFRTPLTVILGGLRDSLDGRFGRMDTQLVQQQQTMLRNTHRLRQLIEQVFDLNRLETGCLELTPEPGCVAEFLQDLTNAHAPLADRKGIDLRLESGGTSCPRQFDRDKLEKIVGNILSNALKYTPRGGRVCVTLSSATTVPCPAEIRAQGEPERHRGPEPGSPSPFLPQKRKVAVDLEHWITISVVDNGPGIPPEAQRYVFERFYRADKSSSVEGTGIGLALALELTQLHGGEIELISIPGKGSTFAIRLPLQRCQIPHPARLGQEEQMPDFSGQTDSAEKCEMEHRSGSTQARKPVTPPDRTTILIIEDNDDVRAYAQRSLGDDYRIIEAVDGETGLHQATNALPDLIVSDVMLPRIDGFGVVRKLKANSATACIPVIMLTARATDDDQTEGYDSGAETYLTKPFSPATLRAVIARILAERHRLRSRIACRETPSPVRTLPTSERLEVRARAVISRYLHDEHFGIPQLASALAMGRTRLFEEIKRATGISPSALILEVRLERARELLQDNAGSVSEVAYAVGFKSLSHFTRRFQQRFGHPPSSYIQ